MKDLNKAIKRIQKTKDLSLVYPKLDKRILHLRVYSDASSASNDDHSSQLGYLILLADDANRCHVIACSSKKSKHIVRSIMAGKVFAFSAAFDHAYIIRHDLESILGQSIRHKMFDVITKSSHTTEKRLMIEVTAAREAYNRHEISNVGLVPGEVNPADGLTKPGYCKALQDLI